MTTLDLLSDTVYRDQARQQLDALLGELRTFPVKKTQLYGLRQIARQQPEQVKNFAEHQRERAERKNLQEEIGFWQLVEKLCDSATGWSVREEGLRHAPRELHEENIPVKKHPGITHAERSARNQLKKRQRKWCDEWSKTHVPAFFERFCTHAVYRLELSETNHED